MHRIGHEDRLRKPVGREDVESDLDFLAPLASAKRSVFLVKEVDHLRGFGGKGIRQAHTRERARQASVLVESSLRQVVGKPYVVA